MVKKYLGSAREYVNAATRTLAMNNPTTHTSKAKNVPEIPKFRDQKRAFLPLKCGI